MPALPPWKLSENVLRRGSIFCPIHDGRRDAETAGFDNWVNAALNGSLSMGGVAHGIATSTESGNYNNTNEKFVNNLYQAFFRRAPDTGGYNGWVGALNSGTSRSDVVDGFIKSQEFCNYYNNHTSNC